MHWTKIAGSFGGDGARLSIGPKGLTLFIRLSAPTEYEVADIRRGKLEVGVVSIGATGILITRFGAATDMPRVRAVPSLVFDAPFHIGLLPPDRRYLPEREGNLSFGLTIIILDELGRQHGGRQVGMALPLAAAIERVVERQVVEAARPGWTKRVHDAEVEQFYARYPDVGRAADNLLRRAWATDTVH